MDLTENEAKAVLGIMKLKNHRLHESSKYSKAKKTPIHNMFLKYVYETISAIPSPESRESIACMLSVSPRNIQIWFQNRRRKELLENINPDISAERNQPDKNSKYKNIDDILLINTYLKIEKNFKQL